MTWAMSSEHLQLLIAGYVLGDLDADEAAEFERLLIEQSAIADEVTQMQKTLELSFNLPNVEPPAYLRSAVLDAHAHSTTVATLPGSTSKRLSRKPFSWSRALNVAAAVVIGVLGVNNYRLRQTLQASQTETQRLAALTFSLKGTQAATAASATVAVNPNNLEAVLTVKNLPPLPPGKVYVLWTLLKQDAPFTTDPKGAILTEVFNVDAQGNVTQPIVVPNVYRSEALVSKVAVTVEDATSPQKHQGKPIMITSL
jgi:anti-sigma-K factor RskA